MNKRICEDCLYCYVDKNRNEKCKVNENRGRTCVTTNIQICPIGISEKDIDAMDELDKFSVDCVLMGSKLK